MRTVVNPDHETGVSPDGEVQEVIETGKTGSQEGTVAALVGSPNAGKTTLFNWMTGSRFKTVNYPGSTVEHSIGSSNARYGEPLLVMDTPGTYSLDAKSPDEQVTMRAIFKHDLFGTAKTVIAIADATALSRHLLLAHQLIEAGFNVILAVTMVDLLSEKNEQLDIELLQKELGVPVVPINGRLGGGVQELLDLVRSQNKPYKKLQVPTAWTSEKLEDVMNATSDLAKRAVKPITVSSEKRVTKTSARERTRQIDRWLLHPIWGLFGFVFFMTVLFSSIFWAAAPVMDIVDKSFSALADFLLNLAPDNLLVEFFSSGVVASAGAVMTFVPQIFILFVGIILLEDSGYLARSATLVDRPLSKLGMGGRSFVPILSGYACAVPAMMAARTINSRRERWLTLFILPLMSCSARLPVYALMLTFLFHQNAFKAGLMLALLYIGSLVVGGLAALIAGRFLKIDEKSFFMMELPVYRLPRIKVVLRQALTRTTNYVRRAGPPIFLFALIVWVGTTFPHYNEKDATQRLNTSYAAQLGQKIEPIFEPMGGDWRTGVGLISAFAAREVFVSSLAVVFQVASTDDTSMQNTLIERMEAAKAPNGYPLFTVASVLGLIVFFMIALQCLSTVMVAVRESGRWRFAILQLVVFNVVAYVLAVGIVQGLRSFGIS